LGGEDNDEIHVSGGYLLGGLQHGDVINGGNGDDTLWFDGSEGDDIISIFTELDGTTGNRYVAIDLDGDGVRDGIIQELTIKNIGVRALAGDDLITVDFGNLDLAGVGVEAGPGDDYVLAGRFDEKLPDGTFRPIPMPIQRSREVLMDELARGTVVPVSTVQSKLTIYGGAGNDTLIGGLDADFLLGDAGDDTLTGGPGDDHIEDGAGNDVIYGGIGYDWLYGGLGRDIIDGDEGNDHIFGGAGPDELSGGKGDDYLDGGPDDDIINRGSGVNVVVNRTGRDLGETAPDGENTLTSLISIAGPEIFVNSGRSNDDQVNPLVAVAPDGSYVIAYESYGGHDGSGKGILAQRYDTSGNPVGEVVFVTSRHSVQGDQSNPAIAIAADGSFVVAWQDDVDTDVWAQRFSPTGLPILNPIGVNSSTTGVQSNPSIAMNPAGDFVIVWQSRLHDGGDGVAEDEVYSRWFGASGEQQGSGVRLDIPGDQTRPTVGVAADGSYVVVWQDDTNTDIWAQRYSPSKNPIGQPFGVNSSRTGVQSNPSIAMNPAGDFVIVWQSHVQDGGDGVAEDEVYYRWFGASGEQQGSGQRLDISGDQTNPTVSVVLDGSYVVSWQDDTDTNIWAQRYSPSKEPIGDYFRVNATRTNLQNSPAVGMSFAGDLVVAWQSRNQAPDNSGYGIFAQRFNYAPPTVVDVVEQNTSQSRAVAFSDPVAHEGPGNVTSHDNWQLWKDGLDISDKISGISSSVDFATGRTAVTVAFATPLTPGDYELVAKRSITDSWGSALDGNADGSGGDDYAERFTIATPPLPAGPLVEIHIPGAVPTDAVRALSRMDGSYVVVWQGPGIAAGETDIYARRFSEEGAALGDAITVNTFTIGVQSQPGIAMDDAGNYVIVWDTTIGSLAAGHVVSGRRFAANGTQLDEEQFTVDMIPRITATWPSVAMDSDGDFVVVWQGNDPEKGVNGSEIFAKRFNWWTGPTDELPIRVNEQSPVGDQRSPDIAMDNDGNFLVTWNSVNGIAINEVMSRWFSADGDGADEFRVNTTTFGVQDSPRVAVNRNGESAIVWRNVFASDADVYNYNIRAQRYDRERRPIGGEMNITPWTVLSESLPDVAIDEAGNLVVVWAESDTTLGIGYSASRFDKWGNLFADEFRVADDADASNRGAAVHASPEGEFVITWSKSSENGESEIAAQRYTLLPPTVESVATSNDRKAIVVGFSQKMETSGDGSAFNTTNWALRLPDGRYLIPGDPETDPLATEVQFEEITQQIYDPTSGNWQVTLPLNFVMPAGSYKLIARAGMRDASGRQLNGDGKGVTSELFETTFTIPAGDYDWDGDVDNSDYGVWSAMFGASGDALAADGNLNGTVDAGDYAMWRENITGDYNGDGHVDSSDYGVWKAMFGASGDALAADGNLDGTVDAADYAVWRNNVGAINLSYGTTIPVGSVPGFAQAEAATKRRTDVAALRDRVFESLESNRRYAPSRLVGWVDDVDGDDSSATVVAEENEESTAHDLALDAVWPTPF
jgi:Ca2+-binding RTX toxin-like protein